MRSTQPADFRPRIGATGKVDGRFVSVTRQTATAIYFRPLDSNAEFPIYDADWDGFAARVDFSEIVYGPRYATLYD